MTLQGAPGGAPVESLAQRTAALCGMFSPIGHERALCDAIEAWARVRFPRVERVKDSLVVRVDGDAVPGRPTVALCGHLDTVPVHDDDRRPPRREGGRLVAPGASDMKGGVAVTMELAERLPRLARFCDLVLVLYAREEGPYLENELEDVLRAPGLLGGVDLALCLEPTDNVLQLGCVGSIHATVTFRGRAAHSARPWHGENAVHRAGALLAELHGRAPREATSGGLVFREVLSATRIEGGHARNVVPDRCTLNLNFRFAPDKTLDAAAAELTGLAARHGAEVELTDLSPACPAYAEHPIVRRLLERTGIGVEPKQAWTDVARLAVHGIPAANLGPGATSQAHQRGEWVELEALARGYELYERFLTAG
ncbi:succinyl-diaminopimelate desuccinylase [Anaeromyxobacter sp. SG66]|uniref:succinyl-diaminopimelate desuccinylase n=1 Tax=Anaeromyxobacter sp. SG66 TaxID=2925410 RepID=UPI001F599B5B|nr:succinyl-diaminopimelate desuccinylase [Anaeromyxobacter sp. SG66]